VEQPAKKHDITSDKNTEKQRYKVSNDIPSNVVYYRDGYSIDLGDIDEDWEVELELKDGEIYRLTRQ